MSPRVCVCVRFLSEVFLIRFFPAKAMEKKLDFRQKIKARLLYASSLSHRTRFSHKKRRLFSVALCLVVGVVVVVVAFVVDFKR